MNIKTKNSGFLALICWVFFILLSGLTLQAQASEQALTKETVRDLINKTFIVMQDNYIEPDVVQNLKAIILNRLELNKYSNLESLADYASVVGGDIRKISGDNHLSLYTVDSSEKITHILSHKKGKLTYNYAFEEVRYLDGNIGYLKFNKFDPDESATDVVDAAFEFLKNSDGMIIDLRDTVGGSPLLAQFILGYFFPPNTPLWEVVDHENKKMNAVIAMEHAGHKKFQADYPVWLLTSRNSASATEIFIGVMQANKKAIVVGSTTAGAGFYVGVRQITPELVFRISLSKPVISANQMNWEKTGIKPDIEVPAMDAMSYAIKAISETLRPR